MESKDALKTKFMRNFEKEFRFKLLEAKYLLMYMSSNPSNIRIVEDIVDCDNYIVFSSKDLEQDSVVAFIDNELVNDPEKIFHFVRKNPNKILYVKFQTNKPLYDFELYVDVLEDEKPIKVQGINEAEIVAKAYKVNHDLDYEIDYEPVNKEIKKLINDLERFNTINQIKIKIDEALDAKDENSFVKYSQQLKKFEQKVVKS